MTKSFARNQVVEIIDNVMKRVHTTAPLDEALLAELQALQAAAQSIAEAFSGADPSRIGDKIPSATQELEAIVEMTNTATNTILDKCDVIQNVAQGLGDDGKRTLEDALTGILEACSFQDLTGQRITKIGKALAEILAHSRELNQIIRDRFGGVEDSSTGHTESSGSLMNGPSLPGQGISQEEIDRLLDDF